MSNPDHAGRTGPQGRDGAALVVFAVGVLGLVALPWAAVRAMCPPPVRPADADPAVFSAARARGHLEAIVRAPRPVGSPAHDDARAYIEEELRRLGLEVHAHEASVSRSAGELSATRLTNVVARLRGADPRDESARDAVLLACHYDSVPGSPGAGDDGAGVAALLESARALAVSPRLPRDVVFLFTDAEERGLLGARAFVREHPWASRVVVAVNLDARGTHGASVMWKISRPDEALLGALARSLERPVASSLVAMLGRALPNDTDGTVFAASGIPSYDFAFAEGVRSYHRATDDLEALDLRSVQHHGDNALALARHFAAAAASGVGRSLHGGAEVAYFDLFARTLVIVSYPWARALVLAAVLLLVTAVAVERRASRLRSGPTLAAALATFAAGGVASALVLAVAAVETSWAAATTMHPSELVAFGTIIVALVTVPRVATMSLRFCTPSELAMGSLLPWLGLTVVVGVLAPAATLPMALPIVGVAASVCVDALWCRTSRARIGALLLGLAPAVYFAATTAFTFHVLEGEVLPWLSAVVVAAFTTLVVPAFALLGRAPARRVRTPRGSGREWPWSRP